MKKHPVVHFGPSKKREDIINGITQTQEKAMNEFLRKVKAKPGDIAIATSDKLPGSIGIVLKWKPGYAVYFDKKGKTSLYQAS